MQKKEEKSGSGARPLHRIKNLYLNLKKENLPQLLIFVLILGLLGGTLVFLAELGRNKDMYARIFDAFWWAFVTITTVGYGDRYPVTPTGRILAIFIMLMGVAATSVFSGTIASIFVDRKIREGKGLKDINLRNHTVICGWNMNSEKILAGLLYLYKGEKRAVVLVNEMDPEEFQALSARYPDMDLRFARGDFVHENVLKRASINTAKSAIIISDTSGPNTQANADERTIMATLTIKALNPGIITSAELLNPENVQHLRRADIDDILVDGEFNGFLLASATMSPGIPHVTKEMLSFESRSYIKQIAIPASFVGKTFSELSGHFLKAGVGILLGLLSEEKKMSLDDILSEGSSAIDAFIKQKFAEAEIDVLEEEREEYKIALNPGADTIIKESDTAFLIGTSK